ncbi:hypothetical protein ACFQ07_27045 [Actinomadura adrarensis]|uniref:Uncharacterized protein n=1 Tax=Actinomadura adrarensis TaxID=1819600 RepID=A0ABW3CNU5_9ACTN
MSIITVTDVAPTFGEDVIAGDRILTAHGWSPVITHFVTPPPDSFAVRFYGEGVRIPFHWSQPIARPLAPNHPVAVQVRKDG